MVKAASKRLMLYLPLADARQAINSLTLQAEQARSLRDLEQVGAIADKLMEITNPLGLESIAVYYANIAGNRGGEGSTSSIRVFETLTQCPLPVVRARAHLALGSEAFIRGDYQTAEEQYNRAEQQFHYTAYDGVGNFHLATMQAVLVGALGNHESSLAQLLNLQKVMKATKLSAPVFQYSLLNSIALELNSLGQHHGASLLIDKVVAAPCAVYYPEWKQSKEEIDSAQPTVRVNLFGMVRKRAAKAKRRATEMCAACDQQRQRAAQMREEILVHSRVTSLDRYRARKERATSDRMKMRIFEALLCASTLTEQVGMDILDLIPA